MTEENAPLPVGAHDPELKAPPVLPVLPSSLRDDSLTDIEKMMRTVAERGPEVSREGGVFPPHPDEATLANARATHIRDNVAYSASGALLKAIARLRANEIGAAVDWAQAVRDMEAARLGFERLVASRVEMEEALSHLLDIDPAAEVDPVLDPIQTPDIPDSAIA